MALKRQGYGGGSITPRRYKGADVAGEWKLRVNLTPGEDGKRREYVEYFKGTKTKAREHLAELVATKDGLMPARSNALSQRGLGQLDVLKTAPIVWPEYVEERDEDGRSHFKIKRDRTVSDVMDAWLSHIEKRGRSASYVAQARRKTKLHIRPDLGSIPLPDLDARVLDTFYDKLLGKKLAPSSVRQLHAFLSSALQQAVKWGWIDRAPTERATPPPVRAPDLPVPTTEDVQALISGSDGVLRRAIALAALTGARRGELMALVWSDIDVEAGTLRIARAVADGKIKDTKTHQVRVLALDEYAIEILGKPGPPDELVLVGITPNTLTQRFRDLADSLNMPYRFHDLRHFSATQLVAAGTDMRTVQGRHGWATLQMVGRYASAVPQRDRDAAGVLGRALKR